MSQIFYLILLCVGKAFCCEVYITQQEEKLAIPGHLLRALSLTETAIPLENNERMAWPWTINVNGKGHMYPTKQDAIDAAKKYQKQGQISIDVGCMQVNLKHHPCAFQNLSKAFDPKANVEYAAKFLKKLKDRLGSWHMAIAHYHSATSQLNTPYRIRVLKNWSQLLQENNKDIQNLEDLDYQKTEIPEKEGPNQLVRFTSYQSEEKINSQPVNLFKFKYSSIKPYFKSTTRFIILN